MKLFTLKRFFVVTLLICLGIGQSWAATFSMAAAQNTYSWTTNDGVTFTLEDAPEVGSMKDSPVYKLIKDKTYKLKWEIDEPEVRELSITQFKFTSMIVGTFGNPHITFSYDESHSTQNTSGQSNLVLDIFKQWNTATLNLSAGNNGEVTIIASDNYNVIGELAYYLQKIEVAYTIVNKFETIAMEEKQKVTGSTEVTNYSPAYVLASSKPSNGTGFVILAGGNTNKALKAQTTAVDVELGTANNAGNLPCYISGGNNQPTEFFFDNSNRIYYKDGNQTYYLRLRSGSRLDGVTNANNGSQFTCTIDANHNVVLKGGNYYLVYSSNAFTSSSRTSNLRIFAKNDNAISETHTEYTYGPVDPLKFSVKANAAKGSTTNYATLYCEDAYEMPGTDIVGYFITYASQEGGELTYVKRYESGEIVPAGTSLLLTGTSGEYSATRYVVKDGGSKTARVYTDKDGNLLEGTRTADGMTDSSRDNVYYYKLTWKDVDHKDLGVIFYWGAENGGAFKLVNPYTAYLAVDKSSNARSFNMPGMEDVDDSEVNSIDEVESSTTDNAVYTISGIRVNDTTNLPSGIYIRNGKKFMVR